MSKRGADKPLDYDNWDSPDEQSAPPLFEQADEATLKSRKMIFVSKKTQPISQSRRGIFKTLDAFGKAHSNSQSTFSTSSLKQETPDSVFLSKLAALNKEVSAWILKHVTEDPYCILTPVFNDYTKHLASIESAKMYSSEKSCAPSFSPFSVSSATAVAPSVGVPQITPSTSSSSFNGFEFSFKSSTSSNSFTTTVQPTFSFGPTPSSASSCSLSSSSLPLFSFNSGLVKPAENSGTTHTAFSATPASNTEQEDEEEYVPPKPEVKEIKEEGSVYTVKCKLFYKKADQWTERGLGNLHIIPSGDEKFQLLIRADTNLGNILLNIMVNKDIPMQLQKNNIVFACIPSPPLLDAPKPKEGEDAGSPPRPVPMLIRVKTPEMAEALLAEFDKHRNKNLPSSS